MVPQTPAILAESYCAPIVRARSPIGKTVATDRQAGQIQALKASSSLSAGIRGSTPYLMLKPLVAPFSAEKPKLLTTTIRAPRYKRIASSATLPVMRARTKAKVVNRFFALMFFTFLPLQSTLMLLHFGDRI